MKKKTRNYHALNAIQRNAGPMTSVKREKQKEFEHMQLELFETNDQSLHNHHYAKSEISGGIEYESFKEPSKTR